MLPYNSVMAPTPLIFSRTDELINQRDQTSRVASSSHSQVTNSSNRKQPDQSSFGVASSNRTSARKSFFPLKVLGDGGNKFMEMDNKSKVC